MAQKPEKARNRNAAASIGVIHELIGFIGRLKVIHFSGGTSKMIFSFARMTKIQEDLQKMIQTITARNDKFEMDRVKDLELAIPSNQPFTGIPGENLFQCDVYCAWACCGRLTRHLSTLSDDVALRYAKLLENFLIRLI